MDPRCAGSCWGLPRQPYFSSPCQLTPRMFSRRLKLSAMPSSYAAEAFMDMVGSGKAQVAHAQDLAAGMGFSQLLCYVLQVSAASELINKTLKGICTGGNEEPST